MILFFDTETTGFFDYGRPISDPSQPHIVSLAAELCDDAGAVESCFSFIVNPGDQVSIPAAAAAVHGVTREKATRLGVSNRLALAAFAELYQRADLICSHNIKFDRDAIEALIFRVRGREEPLSRPLFCTVEAAAPIVNLPPTEKMLKAGYNKPKAPTLAECMSVLFGETLSDAHNAMVDVSACRRIYFELQNRRSS